MNMKGLYKTIGDITDSAKLLIDGREVFGVEIEMADDEEVKTINFRSSGGGQAVAVAGP